MRDLINKSQLDRNLVSLVNAIKARVNNKWDIVIAIDGEEGSGKSTLGIIMGYLLDDKFDLEANVSYLPSTKQMETKFWSLKSKQVFMVDEAIKALYKMRFMDKFQNRINEMYATERWQSKITLLLLPRFTDLNEFFRNHRVKFWIHIVDRGHAVAFAKDETNIATSDRWHLKEEYNRIKYSTYRKPYATFTSEEKLKIYRKSQHYMFDFTFPILPDEIEEEYVKNKEYYRQVSPEEKGTSMQEKILLLARNTDMKHDKIAAEIGCSLAYVYRVVNDYENAKRSKKNTTDE